jgi:hypothetical protein
VYTKLVNLRFVLDISPIANVYTTLARERACEQERERQKEREREREYVCVGGERQMVAVFWSVSRID